MKWRGTSYYIRYLLDGKEVAEFSQKSTIEYEKEVLSKWKLRNGPKAK